MKQPLIKQPVDDFQEADSSKDERSEVLFLIHNGEDDGERINGVLEGLEKAKGIIENI